MAFTLIELLVVITIILILAQVLLPALSTMRKRAHTAACASNLHQLGVAFDLYINDFQYYPTSGSWDDPYKWVDWVRTPETASCTTTNKICAPVGCAPVGSPDNTKWCALGRFANPGNKPCRKSVFWCPADKHGDVPGTSPARPYVISYAMNGGLTLCAISSCAGAISYGDSNHSTVTTIPVKADLVKDPASIYLLYEETEDMASHNGDARMKPSSSAGSSVTDRHNDGANVLFCDGRVIWARKGTSTASGTLDYDVNNDKGFTYDGSGGGYATIKD